MTYEEQLLRHFVAQRAERGRTKGHRGREVEPALRPIDDLNRPERDEARFDDISGMTLAQLGLVPPPAADFGGNTNNTQLIPILL
jgi:hypothetical protein